MPKCQQTAVFKLYGRSGLVSYICKEHGERLIADATSYGIHIHLADLDGTDQPNPIKCGLYT